MRRIFDMAFIIGCVSDQERIAIEEAGYETVELTEEQEHALFSHVEKREEDTLVRVWVDCDVTELLVLR
jgi:hypothetical protein